MNGLINAVMERFKKIFSSVIVFTFVFVGLGIITSQKSLAQILILEPSTSSKPVGESFTVDLLIDTQGKPIVGSDAKILYDATTMEVVSVVKGDFFDVGASNFADPGKLYILGAFNEALKDSVGKGKMATITLKGKKVGSSQLGFVCSTQTNDSNIIDAASNDLIKCAGITDGTYTFTQGGTTGPTSTPQPTSAAGATSTPATTGTLTTTPTPPVSGLALPTIFSFGLGAVLTIIGLAIIF